MAKIITVTANTAIDLHIRVEGLMSMDNILANECVEFACGKGINVAKALASLEHAALCLGFVGQQSLLNFNALASELITIDLIPVTGKTRTNISLFDNVDHREIHIRTPGFKVTDEDLENFSIQLKSSINANDIVVFSGSLPYGAPSSWYHELINVTHDLNAISILDTSGQALIEGLKAAPRIVKPNQTELEALIGHSLANEREVIDAARSLLEYKVQSIIVSRGYHGALAVNSHTSISAKIKDPPPVIESQIGCGDAIVAALAIACLNQFTLEDALALAIGAATANLCSIEPGQFSHTLVNELIGRVEVFEC